MKILLAVDGSSYTKKMLAYLTTHLEVFHADNEFTLFTVQTPLPPRARAAVGADVANAYYAEEAEKVTAPVVKFLKRHGIEAKVVHKTGGPGELIAKQANAGGYDLVMMGSHGHSALGNLVMGSVATQVLAHCKVPVLLVR
ncbi:universal stress protein [Hydrogenophaga bisanensis]|uniref:Universal stress protein n=1 Tax=Hydrogenophaga bisanensis TaxID=439611 RepID=A0ABW2RBY2_9BURK|nr:universal stress protein [Hydrogenophaga sp.]